MRDDLGAQAAAAYEAAHEGDVLLGQNQLPEAIRAYDRAVKLAPRHLGLRFKRALAKAQHGLLHEARMELEVLVEMEADNADYAAALQHIQTLSAQRSAQREVADLINHRGADGAVVLVVDDDEDITRAVADRLQAEGWRVRRAHNLKEALALGTQRPLPSAVVYDYYMGDITGLEVRDELSYRLEQEGFAEPPYVMLTARDNPVTQQYAGKRGARAYVLKSNWLDPEVGLTAAVRKVLRG